MINLVPGLVGLIPFLLLFIGLSATKFKSHVVTLFVLAVIIVLSFFWHMTVDKLAVAAIEGVITALVPITWVIFAAVFTYFVSVETGAMDVVKKFLLDITPDINVQVVIIAFCLGGFLESIAGFGTAVAIPTAMLISIGIKPLKAAVLCLIANSVPVAFGALGIPVIVLSGVTSLDLSLLTKYVAIQLMPFAVLVPVALVLINNETIKGIKRSLLETLFIGVFFTVGQTLTAFFLGPELPALMGSTISLFFFVLYKKFGKKMAYKKVSWAVINYIILFLLVVLTRLIFKEGLKRPCFNLVIPVGGHTIRIDYLSTPGTLLFVSAVAGGLFQGLRLKKMGQLIIMTVNRIKFSALTIINIVVLAKIMGYSGMISSVAGLVAFVSGRYYPLFAPVIGAIGTFVTGSDTSSNILFGELQKKTALSIGAEPAWITASNTSGATAGKMISPQSISVAASTIGLGAEENKIIRVTMVYCLGYVLILGLYVFLVERLFFCKP
ncbi:MAG: L-lactate permease [Candidatus Omnitrophota bacterium]